MLVKNLYPYWIFGPFFADTDRYNKPRSFYFWLKFFLHLKFLLETNNFSKIKRHFFVIIIQNNFYIFFGCRHNVAICGQQMLAPKHFFRGLKPTEQPRGYNWSHLRVIIMEIVVKLRFLIFCQKNWRRFLNQCKYLIIKLT